MIHESSDYMPSLIEVDSLAKSDSITVSKLFWRHLFPRKRRGQGDEVPKIIVSTPTRRKLYEILFRLVRFNLNAFYHMMETLNGLVPFYNKDPGK